VGGQAARLEVLVKVPVVLTAALTLSVSLLPSRADAMCGFIAPKKPPNTQRAARIVNESSKVTLARSGDRTIITMANDVKGDVRSFALVIPVPTKITKKDVKVVGTEIFDQLEAMTAPRVIETQDPNPCAQPAPPQAEAAMADADEGEAKVARKAKPRASDYGVKVEEHFKVGEYDIAILSAKESSGLIEWLNIFKYDIPQDAADVLTSYLRQGMNFFVTRVDLKKHVKENFTFLHPLQISYTTPKLMLPIRLGMLNADGKQELHVWTITDRGRVETTNYRTVKAHTDVPLPVFAMEELNKIYDDAFRLQSKQEGDRVVIQEFAGIPQVENWRQPWDARQLNLAPFGADWVPKGRTAWVTRLHFRYDAEHFPEDLQMQVTDDMAAFAVRYPTKRPWRPAPGQDVCDAGESYLATLPARFEKEAKALADLTGRDRQAIRKRLGLEGPVPAKLPEPPPPKTSPLKELDKAFDCSASHDGDTPALFGLLALACLGLVGVRRRRR
jgi:MYXO-CTERM domain-containing protein